MKNISTLAQDKILVAPSLLAADFGNLNSEIERITTAGADLLHVDVMDGNFVPNLSLGPPVLQSIRAQSKLIFDTHLMLIDPLKYAPIFIKAGADHITFHVESDSDPWEVIKAVKALGATVGLSVKPKTPADALFPYLAELDLVLVMTVEPGFGGQSFMPDMLAKIKAIRKEISKQNTTTHLQVDGGITTATAKEAVTAGANMLVAGTSVFRSPSGAHEVINKLHKLSLSS